MNKGELHIFQCVSDYAQKIAEDLNNWMSKHGNNNQINNNEIQNSSKFGTKPSPAIKVKDAVSVFNAIIDARRERFVISISSLENCSLINFL